VSGFGGQSLFGLFTAQIGQELANFPTGPSIDSPFWLYLIVYHAGLFACIML
jgi:photosystem I subunit PsaO